MYLIYKHTSPSGKSYIGQTNDIDRRNRDHNRSYSGCTAFCNAIQKYGWNSFTHEILIDNLTLEQANILEEHFIAQYNTLSPNGYNLTTGGNNRLLSEETKQKIRQARLGIKRSEETKRRMSIANIGKKVSIETKQKLVEVRKNESNDTKSRRNEASKLAKQTAIYSEEFRQKIRDIRLGTTRSEETKQKISENSARRGKEPWNKGIKLTEKQLEKRKLLPPRAKRGPEPLVTCPHCGKVGGQGNMMNRWHFDNCRLKTG